MPSASEPDDLVDKDHRYATGIDLAIDDQDLVDPAVQPVRLSGTRVLQRQGLLIDAAQTFCEVGHDLLNSDHEDHLRRARHVWPELASVIEAAIRLPVSVTAWTLPSITSGAAASRRRTLTRFGGHMIASARGLEWRFTMGGKTHPPYPPEFKAEAVRMLKAGRDPAQLARTSACPIRVWPPGTSKLTSTPVCATTA